MAEGFRIRRITEMDRDVVEQLADVTLDVVQGGASVGFMLPLSRTRALSFWESCLAAVERKERLLLVAEAIATRSVVGTVQVLMAMPDNQPHRGDVAKMQVHRRARRSGIGSALMQAAEREALAAGKTLLVLDTVTGSEAERLYARLGLVRVGEIPEYALWPDGGLCATTVFYRRLAQPPPELTTKKFGTS